MKEMEENFGRLKTHHLSLEQEVKELSKIIIECRLKSERANKLLNGLGGEKQKWLVCNRMIAKKFLTI